MTHATLSWWRPGGRARPCDRNRHRLGMKSVYIPEHSAVFSALGGATADYGRVFNRFYYKRDDLAKLAT